MRAIDVLIRDYREKHPTIKNIYYIWFLLEFNIGVFWAIWSVNVIDQGYTYYEACIALAIYLFVIALFEIPTGFIGDKFGYKKVTIIGILVSSLGFFLLSISGPSFFLYASLGIAALGISLCNGSKQVWFIDAARAIDPRFHRDKLFVDLEIPRRIAQIAGAYVGSGLNQIDPALTWYSIACSGFIAALISSRTTAGDGTLHTDAHVLGHHGHNVSFAAVKEWGLLFVFLASFLYGIDLAIRGLILSPFVVKILNNGNSMAMGTVTLVGASMGILGNKWYKLITTKRKIDKTIFIIASLLFYSFSESIFLNTTSFYLFLFLYGLCVFTMGWFVALHDVIALDFISENRRAISLSAASMLRNLSAALTLVYLAPRTYTLEHLRSYWQYASIGLLLCGFCYIVLFFIRRNVKVSITAEKSW